MHQSRYGALTSSTVPTLFAPFSANKVAIYSPLREFVKIAQMPFAAAQFWQLLMRRQQCAIVCCLTAIFWQSSYTETCQLNIFRCALVFFSQVLLFLRSLLDQFSRSGSLWDKQLLFTLDVCPHFLHATKSKWTVVIDNCALCHSPNSASESFSGAVLLKLEEMAMHWLRSAWFHREKWCWSVAC